MNPGVAKEVDAALLYRGPDPSRTPNRQGKGVEDMRTKRRWWKRGVEASMGSEVVVVRVADLFSTARVCAEVFKVRLRDPASQEFAPACEITR